MSIKDSAHLFTFLHQASSSFSLAMNPYPYYSFLPQQHTVTYNKSRMRSSICLVCSSPTANSLHFGARTCKACAAFFRRTISMGMNYACTTEDASIPCKIHYHLRMICRACRFEKCLRAGMKEGMVQKKLDEEKKSSSPKCRKRLMTEQTASSSYGSREVKTELRDDEPVPSEPTQERRSASTSRDLFDFHTPLTNSDDVIAHYRASEMGLHDRRRMLHGSCSLHDLFDDREDAPFRREHLRPFNITTFSGPSRPDLMCIMEQTRELSLFKRLAMRSDKTLIVRYVLSVDYVLSSAFLTEKLGIEEDILVLNDATFLKMKPLPLTGYEASILENARAQFKSNQEWETNKAFMPLFIRKWSEVIIPYFEMRLSFTEYVLLKTLTVYQMVHYRLTEDGKTLCSQHRDLIISALHRTAELEGLHDPVQRVGEIILLMSTIMNYTSSLIGRYFKITLCNQFSAGNEIKIDSMIQEMCSYQF